MRNPWILLIFLIVSCSNSGDVKENAEVTENPIKGIGISWINMEITMRLFLVTACIGRLIGLFGKMFILNML